MTIESRSNIDRAVTELRKTLDVLARAKTGGAKQVTDSGPLHPFAAIGYAKACVGYAMKYLEDKR